MKKTLLGVLAFILVFATVLTGTVLAADDDAAASTTNKGKVYMVDADHPIQVDGELDEAYTTATPLLINFRTAEELDIYTHGWARFVWSKAENALYCHVLMNDVEVSPAGEYPWNSDSVELFVDLTNTGTQEWGIAGLTGEGAMSRGLQYRIDGYKGNPSCYLLEESSTYTLDRDKGRLANPKNNLLINENTNIFGWEYANNDPVKRGWGYKLTEHGYMVEFRINASGQGMTLADGQTFRFDIQVNDRYRVIDPMDSTTPQNNVYYSSTYRYEADSATAGSVIGFYDTLTLTEETAKNTYSAVAEAALAQYGMVSAENPYSEPVKETERTYTSRVSITRIFTTRKGNTTTKPQGGNNPGGGDEGGSNPGTSSGGCGGSIAIGTSVAMIAMVGATGFFAFRRKDEE